MIQCPCGASFVAVEDWEHHRCLYRQIGARTPVVQDVSPAPVVRAGKGSA